MKPLLLVLLALLVIALATFVGRSIDGSLSLGALSGLLEADQTSRDLLLNYRLPRALLAALTGMSLAASGLLVQRVLDNPLASPFTLGTASGASLAVMLAVAFGGMGAASVTDLAGLSTAAFVGAVLVTLPLVVLSARRRAPAEAVLLLGVALSFAIMAVSTGINAVSPASSTFAYIRWTLGSLAVAGWDWAGLAPVVALPVVAAWWLRWQLDAMSSGDELALARGISVGRLRALTLLAMSASVGASVAICGPIGFIGLAAPHIAAGIVGASATRLWWAAPLVGAVLLCGADLLGRILLTGVEVPVGVMTSALGAPILTTIVILRYSRRAS